MKRGRARATRCSVMVGKGSSCEASRAARRADCERGKGTMTIPGVTHRLAQIKHKFHHVGHEPLLARERERERESLGARVETCAGGKAPPRAARRPPCAAARRVAPTSWAGRAGRVCFESLCTGRGDSRAFSRETGSRDRNEKYINTNPTPSRSGAAVSLSEIDSDGETRLSEGVSLGKVDFIFLARGAASDSAWLCGAGSASGASSFSSSSKSPGACSRRDRMSRCASFFCKTRPSRETVSRVVSSPNLVTMDRVLKSLGPLRVRLSSR